VAQVGELLAATQVPANSDARPVCYAYTLMLWLSKFYPRAGRFDPTGGVWSAHARAAWLWGLGAAGVLLAWLLARRPPWRGPAVVAVAGAAGMLTESLVLLAYQAREGALYQDLGLLLMVFMAGLALGAAAVNRLAWGRLGRRAGRALGAGALLGVAVVCLLLAARLGSGGGMGLAEAGLWLVAAGMVSAAVFASASHAARDQARAVGPLYGADLLGGGVASLLGSLALIPMLGLSGAALLTAVVALIALLGA
jgi:spermidine synthase